MDKYQGRVDPLELLRSFVTQKKKIKYKEGSLYFDNVKLKVTTETPWLSPITSKQYDLGSLWLLLDCDQKGQDSVQYIERTSQLGVEIVNTADKGEILNYFNGKKQTSECISNELKLEITQKLLKKEKETEDPGPSKKPKVETENDLNLQVLMWLKSFEKPLMSKTRAIRTPEKSYEETIKALKGGSEARDVKVATKTKLALIYEKKKNPILIVPDISQPGNVCIKNLKSLLVDGCYQEPAQLEDTTARKVEIVYPIREKNVTFDITNNPSLLTPADWSCVVAIFVSGRHAQFSGWQQTIPAKLFLKYRGFFLKYSDSKAGEAGDWNVKVIQIQKMTRFQDVDVQKYLWDEITRDLLSPVE